MTKSNEAAIKCDSCGTAIPLPADVTDDYQIRCPDCGKAQGTWGAFKVDTYLLLRRVARTAKQAGSKKGD
jgi:DNA-directed RNA polymerase subunit RPC12/RpoP